VKPKNPVRTLYGVRDVLKENTSKSVNSFEAKGIETILESKAIGREGAELCFGLFE